MCVSQMASVWLHGHTLATSNNTPQMPHPQRERRGWSKKDSGWGEGVVIEWKWLAKTSESQAPQQTHHSSNSHQVIHANPQACYTTTKSHSSATHTHTKWRQARRQGWHKASVPQQSEAPTTMVFCHHTHAQAVQPSSQPVQKALGVGVCGKAHATHSHTHHKGVVRHG